VGSRYDLDALRRGIRDPRRIAGEFRYLATSFNRLFHADSDIETFPVMDADWDLLVIIDGCRYDLFIEESSLPGTTTSIQSGASQSREFMEAHFFDEKHHDTVYVSANPHAEQVQTGDFYDVHLVYESQWDADAGTVLPRAVVEETVVTAERFPDKRIIAHFMQPHHPFLGEHGEFDSGKIDFTGDDVWTQLRNFRCPTDDETVWKAYAENYRLLEPWIRKLDAEVTGKTVVTSDHGNLVGERLSPIPVRGYGHPGRIRHPVLNTVPWHEMPVDSRRHVESASPKELTDGDGSVRSKLEDLGYV
jgi:hypothetical protein